MSALDGLLVDIGANPFLGLRSFTSEDAGIYFGREDEVREMISRLERGRLLALVGDSGVGKSSLVAAGLIPELTLGALAGRHTGWTVIRFQPGLTPIRSLAQAVAACGPASQQVDDLDRTLRLSSLALARLLGELAAGGGTNVLLFADQFEEIFAYEDEKQTPEARMEASLYVRLLLEACQFPGVPVYLLLTMRSEYLGRTIEFTGLPEALNDGQYLVPQLRGKLRETIIGPAAVRGASVSPGLVQVLLNEASKPGNLLPVLQHALMRTWLRARQRVEKGSEPEFELRLGDYAGGVASSLEEHATEVISRLPEPSQAFVRLIFQAVTIKDLAGHVHRRPVTVEGLCRLLNASMAELSPILEAFSAPDCAMLSIRPAGPLTGKSNVDLTHESLIWKWPALAQWIDEEARDSYLFKNALEDANRYRKGEDTRWRGVQLAEAVRWSEQPHHGSDWVERYVRTPGALDEVRAFIRRSKKRENRENARSRLMWLLFLLLFCVALVAALMFWNQANDRKDANARLQKVNDELADRKRALDGTVATLTSKQMELNNALGALGVSKEDLLAKAKDLEAAKAGLQSRNDTLTTKQEELTRTIGDRDSAVKELRRRNDELAANRKALTDSVEELREKNETLEQTRRQKEESEQRAASARALVLLNDGKEALETGDPIVALDRARAALGNANAAGEMPTGLAALIAESLRQSRVVTTAYFRERLRDFGVVTEPAPGGTGRVVSQVVALAASGALLELDLPCGDTSRLSMELRNDVEPSVLAFGLHGLSAHARSIPKAAQTELADAMKVDRKPAIKAINVDSGGGVLLGFEDGSAVWVRYKASREAIHTAMSEQRARRIMEEQKQSKAAYSSARVSIGESDVAYDLLQIYRWRPHSHPLNGIYPLPDEKGVLSVDEHGSWAQYSLRDLHRSIFDIFPRVGKKGHGKAASSVSQVIATDMRRDGSMFAILGERGLSVWSLPDSKEIPTPNLGDLFQGGALAIHPTRRWVVISERNGLNLHLADLERSTFNYFQSVKGNTTALAWSPNGQYLAAGDQNGTVMVYRPDPRVEGSFMLDFLAPGHLGSIRKFVWTGPETLASFGSDNRVRLWDLSRRTILSEAEDLLPKILTDEAARRKLAPLLAGTVRRLVDATPNCTVQ